MGGRGRRQSDNIPHWFIPQELHVIFKFLSFGPLGSRGRDILSHSLTLCISEYTTLSLHHHTNNVYRNFVLTYIVIDFLIVVRLKLVHLKYSLSFSYCKFTLGQLQLYFLISRITANQRELTDNPKEDLLIYMLYLNNDI